MPLVAPYSLMYVDVTRRVDCVSICVTYPPKPWADTVIYGDTSTRIDVV